MPTVNSPNFYQVEIRCTLDGQNVEHVFHLYDPLLRTTYGDLCDDIAAGVLAEVVSEFRPRWVATVTLREVFVKHLGTASPFTGSAAAPVGTVGTKAGAAVPNSIAACMSLKTVLSGRSNRGRKFLFGFSEGDVTNNAITPAELEAWADAWLAVVNTVESALTLVWVVLSLVSNGVPRTTGSGTAVTELVFVDSSVDSQRRRLPGRGT